MPGRRVSDEGPISIDPNYADGYVQLGQTMLYSGRFEESLQLVKKGIRLCPKPRPFYPWSLGYAYFMLRRYEMAIATGKSLLERCQNGECPPEWARSILIASYMEHGMEKEARTEAQEVLKARPTISLELYRRGHPYKDPANLERLLSAWRKAGIPEHPPSK